MARSPGARAMVYQSARTDLLQFIHAFAHLPGRDDTIDTPPITKGEAFAFRRRFYTWRTSALAALAVQNSPEWQAATKWFTDHDLVRVTREWLQYCVIRAIPRDDGTWLAQGQVTHPCFGQDFRFEDHAQEGVADMKAMILAAQARQRDTRTQ